MRKNAASTKTLQASKDDFVCTRENVLWLLGYESFYKHCPSFEQLWLPARQMSEYMRANGFADGDPTDGCGRCDIFKVLAWQNMLLDGFAEILLWAYDAGRMQELRTLKAFASAAKRLQFKRVILVYAGKATKKKERRVIVE